MIDNHTREFRDEEKERVRERVSKRVKERDCERSRTFRERESSKMMGAVRSSRISQRGYKRTRSSVRGEYERSLSLALALALCVSVCVFVWKCVFV